MKLKPANILLTALVVLAANALLYAQESARPATPTSPNIKALEADAMYYDAIRARVKGDDKEEEKLLLQVVGIKPDASGAYYDLARLYFKANRSDKASEYIKKAIALDADNVWYKTQYAEVLVQAKQYEEAAKLFDDIAKRERYNEEYLLKAFNLYQHIGKYDEALATINKYIEKDPDNEEAIDMKKKLLLKRNDVDGVVKVIEKQIERNPNEGKYYAELADVYDNNKLTGKAAEMYKKMETQFADDPSVQLSLAEYYQKKNNQQKYDEYMKKLITNRSLDADVQLSLLGPIIVESGNDTMKRRQGLELISLLAVQHPENARVAAFYGDVLAFNNQLGDAIVQYKKSVQIDPSSYKIWESLLLANTDRENADSLIRYSEKALRLFPNQAMFHYLNGVGHMNKKDYNKAVKSINRGIDMQPDDNKAQLAQMYTTLGDVYNYMKRYSASDSSYEQALQADPMNATVLNNYAYYLSVRGMRLDDAAKMSKKSLDIRKDEPSFLDTYGWILYKQGKYDDARTYIQKAIDINGEQADGTLWEHLGDVYYKQGNIDKAVECWTKAKEKGTDNTDIDKKIKDRKLYEI
ncbi:hypothetical protein CAP35_14935 [Chitinophagaceae bacterium IBVUCB1]|nr:hypothetical protein CAP35_14935 [Chitinophagaceae bacterium IBVUCB1]